MHLGKGLRYRSWDLAVPVRVKNERVIVLKECLEGAGGTKRGLLAGGINLSNSNLDNREGRVQKRTCGSVLPWGVSPRRCGRRALGCG